MPNQTPDQIADDSPEESRFMAFVQGLEPRLIGYLTYASGSRTEAEDLFQETCLRLHRNWRKVQALDRPESWVFRVAHNLNVNRFKRKDVERRAISQIGERAREAQAPDDPSSAGELSGAIEGALADLPDKQREAVCQKVWGGCTWIEIGQVLEVSDDTAARLCARGLKTLASTLKGFALDGDLP